MTEKDSETLAHEAEAARARFADTAESLWDKMSPGQMVDETMRYFRNSDGALALDNLKTQVRDNPLPLALIGAGLGWFFLGGGPKSDRIAQAASDMRERSRHSGRYDEDRGIGSVGDRDWYSDSDSGDFREPGRSSWAEGRSSSESRSSTWSDAARSAGEAMSSGASSIGDAASAAGGAFSQAASDVGHSMSSAGRGAASAMHGIRDRAGRAGDSIQHRFSDVLERDPLILGALGIALGVAVAAMLPRTRTEDEYLGPYRDRMQDEAERQLERGKQEAAQAASTLVSTVEDEMKKEGLTTEGGPTVTERVANAAKSAAQKTEKKIREDMGAKTDKSVRGSTGDDMGSGKAADEAGGKPT